MMAKALFNFWKVFQSSCEAVSNISLLKFLPQQGLRGYFILTEGEVSFKLLKKHRDSKWVGFCFLCSRTDVVWKLSAKTKQNNLCITDMSENKTNNFNKTRSVGVD